MHGWCVVYTDSCSSESDPRTNTTVFRLPSPKTVRESAKRAALDGILRSAPEISSCCHRRAWSAFRQHHWLTCLNSGCRFLRTSQTGEATKIVTDYWPNRISYGYLSDRFFKKYYRQLEPEIIATTVRLIEFQAFQQVSTQLHYHSQVGTLIAMQMKHTTIRAHGAAQY